MSTDLNLYIGDLVQQFKETFAEARSQIGETEKGIFQQGRAMAYAEVLNRMQHEADAFQIPRSDLGLADFDPIAVLNAMPIR